MKFKVKVKTLLDNLKVLKATKPEGVINPSMVVKLTVNNNKLNLYAAKSWLTLNKSIDIVDAVNGELNVNLITFINILSKLKNKKQIISCEVINNNLIISGDSVNAKLNYCEAKVTKLDLKLTESFSLTVGDLFFLLNKTINTALKDNTRTYLQGVHFEKKENALQAVTTDGHRLSLAKIEGFSDLLLNSFLLPIDTSKLIVKEIKKANQNEKASISLGEDCIAINFDGLTIESILGNNNFPNYEKIFSQFENVKTTFSIDKSLLKEKVEIESALCDCKLKEITLRVKNNNLYVFNRKLDNQNLSPLCVYNSEDFEFSVNGKYLSDFLNLIDNEKVIFNFNDPEEPIEIRSEGVTHYKFAIMPLRAKNKE